MKEALAELQAIIDEAIKYAEKGNHHPQYLRQHVKNVVEEMQAIQEHKPYPEEFKGDVDKLCREGRRIKRAMEEKAIDLELVIEYAKQQKETQLKQEPSATPTSQATGIKVAPLKIPTFDGEYSRFKPFLQAYKENILNNPAITDTGKWVHLRESLQGRPSNLIAEIPQQPETLQTALRMLEDVYGDDDRVISELHDKLENLPTAGLLTVSLRDVQARMEGILLSLEALKQPIEENRHIRNIVLSKFPSEVVYKLVKKKNTTLTQIRLKLRDIIEARESVDRQVKTLAQATSELETKRDVTRQGVHSNKVPIASQQRQKGHQAQPPKCLFCEGRHWADECDQFTTAEDRKEKIPNRCYKCLRLKHPGANCVRERRCVYCDQLTHNRALCPTRFPMATQVLQSLCIKEQKSSARKKASYLTLMTPVSAPGKQDIVEVRSAIDTCGGTSLVTQGLVERLRLPKSEAEPVRLTGLNGAELLSTNNGAATLLLHPPKMEPIVFTGMIVESIAEDLRAADVQIFRGQHPQYAELDIPPTGQGKPIEILIANDTLLDIATIHKSITVDTDTQLFSTKFGWIVMNRDRSQTSRCQVEKMLLLRDEEAIKQMYDLEIVGLEDILTSDIENEQQAIDKFYESVTFKDNRYMVDWPWQSYPPNLSDNFGVAVGRLRSMWKRLHANKNLLQQYHEIILQQKEDKIIEEAPTAPDNPQIINYLPHHPVICPEKSTKIRPVCDASAKTKQGKSLNDNMLKGKKWLNDLVAVLVRFRRYKTAVVADIAKAFHQVAIHTRARDAVRFLWLRDPNLPPEQRNLVVYRFCRVAFGVVSSPFLLHAVIAHHLSQKNNDFSENLRNDLYADNLVTTLPRTIAAEKFYKQQKEFFQSMSMNLTKWATNGARLLAAIAQEDRQIEELQMILGLHWHIPTDTLQIKRAAQLDSTSRLTKRVVLRQTAAVFDPLGWAAPITLLAKLFIRKVWEREMPWDGEFTQELQEEWASLLQTLKQTSQIVLPRQMFRKLDLEDAVMVQIHTFVDASMQAYAMVVYAVAVSIEGKDAAFIAAKSRLAPKKKLSIPRLELLAMLTGARYTRFLKEALQIPAEVETYIWSDSKCALAWVNSNKILPAVVEKQVQHIKANKITQYKHVPAQQNRADVASRGADRETLEQQRWWEPTGWILEQDKWPKYSEPGEEQLAQANLLLQEESERTAQQERPAEKQIGLATINIKRFSTLSALLRRTAHVIYAINKLCKKQVIKTQAKHDYAAALKLWIRWDQRQEYVIPQTMKQTRKHRNMTLVEDDDGIIRCITRITAAQVPVTTSQPILLTKSSHLTKLIIMQIHRNNQHVGVPYTLANLRREYWLPQGRREVFKVLNAECYTCRKFNAKTFPNPVPAPLPQFRVEKSTQPFQSIGMDIFGPYLVRMQNQKGAMKTKRWVIIFVCAIVRAVHLETIGDMTVDEILMAFRRFISRRGTPQLILCDNAPQFHALDRRFVNLWPTVLEAAPISQYFAQKQILFKYVPQNSPWMGGMYERIIQTVKAAFERTYSNIILHQRQFETSIIEIEGMLNARPLTYVDAHIESPIITPNDFLSVKFPAVDITNMIEDDKDIVSRLWRASQKHLDVFWQHWSDFFLLSLRERNDQLQKKKGNSDKQPKTGDIVLIAEPQKKRSSWRLAIIERLVHSSDGQIRSAQIRLANGTRTLRPIIKMAPLHLNCALPGISDNQLNVGRDAVAHDMPKSATQRDPTTMNSEVNEPEEIILGIDDLQQSDLERAAHPS